MQLEGVRSFRVRGGDWDLLRLAGARSTFCSLAGSYMMKESTVYPVGKKDKARTKDLHISRLSGG